MTTSKEMSGADASASHQAISITAARCASAPVLIHVHACGTPSAAGVTLPTYLWREEADRVGG